MQALHINGNDLTLEDLREVVYAHRPVLLAADARHAVERARAVVEDQLAQERVAYAVNTGVGKLATVRIPAEHIRELQVNLMRSHAAGVGEPLSELDTRAIMLLRANSLAKGFSGVRPVVIDTLCEMLNRGVHPLVPSQGSVGASGDLAPLAHLGLVAELRRRRRASPLGSLRLRRSLPGSGAPGAPGRRSRPRCPATGPRDARRD